MVVKVISTGGTIASTPDSGDGVKPELRATDLVDAVPGLEAVAAIETHDFATVPSPHFTIDQMAELAKVIESYDAEPAVEGMVVTQGTDILEETAYFVDRTYGGETPVVFTGAMRNPSMAGPDGPANLLASVRTAVHDESRGRGVLVAFNDRVHAASDVTKVHSMNPDTFRSPEFDPVAVQDEDRVVWHRPARNRPAPLDIDRDELTNEVAAITVTADMPPSFIPEPEETAAVCLAATGAGHIPPTIIPPLEDLVPAGVPLVTTTRCPEGRLARNTYDFEGSERTLQELGCYFSARNLQKTRIETILALAADGLDTAFCRPDWDG